MAKKIEELNNDTPQWFKDWHNIHFLPVRTLGRRNEKLVFVILASVVVLNTIGNYYHDEVIQFLARLFG